MIKHSFPIGTREHYLDSGAHSLLNKYVLSRKVQDYSFYKTPEFWQYVDEYAAFIKKYQNGIDYYATVDVIYDPELTWDVQRYMQEQHGLWPMPVIHYGCDLKWLDRYMEIGHDYIGIGGLGQTVVVQRFPLWGDRVFKHICPASNDCKPLIRTHGFAIGTSTLILRYPWRSIDAATWVKMAYYGQIFIPRKSKGDFDLSIPCNRWFVTDDSPYKGVNKPSYRSKGKHKHYLQMRENGRKDLDDWLQLIGVPFGKTQDGEVLEPGISNDVIMRQRANVEYLERLSESLPKWPWAFTVSQTRPGLLEAFGKR